MAKLDSRDALTTPAPDDLLLIQDTSDLTDGATGTSKKIELEDAMAGSGDTIIQIPTITAGAYSANDAVGGLLTFANAARVSGGGGIVKSLIILDDEGQDAELELWLFSVTFTAMADNDAWAPSEGDMENLVGIVTTTDGAYFQAAAGARSAARVEASQRYDLTATSLFGQLVTRGTPTYAATDDISVILGILQD